MDWIKHIGREWYRRIDEAKTFWQNLFNRKLTRSFTSRRSLWRALISSSSIWATSSGRTSTGVSTSIKADNVLPIDTKPRKASNKTTLTYSDGGSIPPTSTIPQFEVNSNKVRVIMDYGILNTGFEIAVLGLLMLHPHSIYNVAPKLKPEMFSSSVNANIYRAMQAVTASGLLPEYTLVIGSLKDMGQLDSVGGAENIESVIQRAKIEYNIKSLDEYVRRVQDAYKITRLLKFNAEIPRILDDKPGTINEVISKLSENLNKLVSDVGVEDVSIIGDTIDETLKRIKERLNNPGPAGVSTGFPTIDHFTGGLMDGEIWYIGARPTMGKSAWLTKVFINVAKAGVPCLMFNREMSAHSINERMLAILSGVDALKIRQSVLEPNEFVRLEKAKAVLKDLPIYVDNNFTGDIDYIYATIRKHQLLNGIRVVGLDYIQLIVERADNSVHLLGNASRRLKLLSNELGLTTIIISQMNRNVEGRENKRPLMADLRQSGNLEEDADIMAALYRDEVYESNSSEAGKMEFIIRKSRNGPIGVVHLDFDGSTVNVTEGLDAGEGFI